MESRHRQVLGRTASIFVRRRRITWHSGATGAVPLVLSVTKETIVEIRHRTEVPDQATRTNRFDAWSRIAGNSVPSKNPPGRSALIDLQNQTGEVGKAARPRQSFTWIRIAGRTISLIVSAAIFANLLRRHEARTGWTTTRSGWVSRPGEIGDRREGGEDQEEGQGGQKLLPSARVIAVEIHATDPFP